MLMCTLLIEVLVRSSNNQSTSRVRSLKPWLDAIGRSVERSRGNAREPALFAAACTVAEIVAEGRLKLAVARTLLEGWAQGCGLWRELGAEGCRQTIANGFRHVEEKMLNESTSAAMLNDELVLTTNQRRTSDG